MPLKNDIVKRMHELLPHHLKKDLNDVVDLIVGRMVDALDKGDRIEVRGFGSFSIRTQRGKIFKNPKTGEIHEIPSRKRVIFKAGKDLKGQLKP